MGAVLFFFYLTSYTEPKGINAITAATTSSMHKLISGFVVLMKDVQQVFLWCCSLSLLLTVQMDKTASESQCGKVFVLGPSHEVRMTSEGQAPDGYCGISLFTPRKARNFTCDAICVTFKTASVSTCEVKVKFVGHKFRKEGDLQKVS